MKARLKRVLLWGAMFGPAAFLLADRFAHLFGICLGH